MDEIHQFNSSLAFRVGFLRRFTFLQERVVAPRDPQKDPRSVEGVVARFVSVRRDSIPRVASVEVDTG